MLSAPAEPDRLDEQIADPESRIRLEAPTEACIEKSAGTCRVQGDLGAAISKSGDDKGTIASTQDLPGTYPAEDGGEHEDIYLRLHTNRGRAQRPSAGKGANLVAVAVLQGVGAVEVDLAMKRRKAA